MKILNVLMIVVLTEAFDPLPSENHATPLSPSEISTQLWPGENDATPLSPSENSTTPLSPSENSTTPLSPSENSTTPLHLSVNDATPLSHSVNGATPLSPSENVEEQLSPSENVATPLPHGHHHGYPLSIMQFTTNQSVTVDYDEIDRIFLHPEVKDRKMVVISIIGAFRKGKSFFMDYCLRYMYAHYKSVNFPNNTLGNKRDWIGSPEAPLTGFSWKAGPHRHTSGIIIWSDIFLHENLSIVLMDTQGLFDQKAAPADNSRIFALGTLVSSFQIYNLNDVIQENQLEYLQMATDYAKFVTNSSMSSTGKPFQSILFLMRDWSSSHTFSYGFVGGQHYLADVLKVRDYQSPELKDVRNYIMSSFENVLCFLMPHPGLEVVRDNNYDGRFSRLSNKFQDNLKQLLEWMLDSTNLKIKTVLGSEVTGHDFSGYFKSYFETFQSPDTPKIPSIYEATIERQFRNFLDTAMDYYKEALKEYQPDYNIPNFNEVLEELHKNCSYMVILGYNKEKKMGSVEHENRYRAILEKDITAFYDQWKQGMLQIHERIHEIEAKNMQEKRKILDESETKFANATGKLEADKKELLAKQKEREQQIRSDMQRKDEEKEEAIKKIHDEMKQQDLEFENERQQIIAQQKAVNEKILTDTENRRRKAEDEVNQLKAIREKTNVEFQMQLQKERDERFERIKQEAKDREEERQMEQKRRDKEDADRKEEMQLLRNKIDAESKDRRERLELEEKRREEERKERLAEQIIQKQKFQQEKIEREKDRQQERAQFNAEINSLRRNGAGTITSPNLFCITFAVGVFSLLMFRNFQSSQLM